MNKFLTFKLENGRSLIVSAQTFYESLFKHDFEGVLDDDGTPITVKYSYNDEAMFQFIVTGNIYSEIFDKPKYNKDVLISLGYDIKNTLRLLDIDPSLSVDFNDVSAELTSMKSILGPKAFFSDISNYICTQHNCLYRLENSNITCLSDTDVAKLNGKMSLTEFDYETLFVRRSNAPLLKIVEIPIESVFVIPMVTEDSEQVIKNKMSDKLEEGAEGVLNYLAFDRITFDDENITIN